MKFHGCLSKLALLLAQCVVVTSSVEYVMVFSDTSSRVNWSYPWLSSNLLNTLQYLNSLLKSSATGA